LADIAKEIDLDRNEAIAVLTDQRFAQTVRDTEEFWVKQGIQGVPAAVFDRQHLVTGAQGVENYTNILQQLVNKEA
jgi:predicted DsbA family dithiol-disulfide isomerase